MDFNPRLHEFLWPDLRVQPTLHGARPSGSTHFFVPDLRVQPTTACLATEGPTSRLLRGARPSSASVLGIRLSSSVLLDVGQHTRSPRSDVRGEVVGKE